ncbi:GNAT family N-acetyltransferase [Herbiconiux sp. CPCC 205763]|uniref:GNAT family N-acetyltransferase n=1 Tax=Herbiconiux aconitum TaxID=2970913 RepID=A0ABT2GSF0_9MICO|nr:GNAT family N-acetyltransferase [Herbiconiux aconitum]MCS5719152.1 GNAT family N-acetyltransferase [Herbiconiux aconitum]
MVEVIVGEVGIADGVVLRLLRADDAGRLADSFERNRDHLAHWDPVRPEAFFTELGQAAEIDRALQACLAGVMMPLVLVSGGEIVGRANLTGITRGAFQNAILGYWIDARLAGRGVMTATVAEVLRLAREELALHRVEASTLLENAASQAVLRRNGFEKIGEAPRYLKIAGRWQDHLLFQRILHD